MVPLVGEVKELKYVKDVIVKTADALIAAAGVDMKYEVCLLYTSSGLSSAWESAA